MVQYIGQYECATWFREQLPDTQGEMRSAIRFELQPVEEGLSRGGAEPAEREASVTDKETESGVIELPSGNEQIERREITAERIERDSAVIRSLKKLYDDTCQVCGDRRLQDLGEGFSHGHHLMPLGKPHEGPDVRKNVIIVCPNHHEDFEHGMLTIDPKTLEISHEYEEAISGEIIDIKEDHNLGAQYLAYHNQVVAGE